MNDPRDYLERMLPGHNLDEYWRMHYAGLAMPIILERCIKDGDHIYQGVSVMAFKIADAMIEESKKVSHD